MKGKNMDYWPQDQESPYQEYPPRYQYEGYRPPEYSQQHQQLLYPQSQWQQEQQWATQEKVRPISDKKWLTAFLLFIFLTPFGVHRFYAGKIGTGILQILMSCGFFIWPLMMVLFFSTLRDSIGILFAGMVMLQMIALLGFAIWAL